MPRDIVCMKEVTEDTAFCQSVYRETVFMFCSEECKQRFDEDPDKYLVKIDDSEMPA